MKAIDTSLLRSAGKTARYVLSILQSMKTQELMYSQTHPHNLKAAAIN